MPECVSAKMPDSCGISGVADSLDGKPWLITAAGKDYPLPIR
jgi:hypothetical protein